MKLFFPKAFGVLLLALLLAAAVYSSTFTATVTINDVTPPAPVAAGESVAYYLKVLNLGIAGGSAAPQATAAPAVPAQKGTVITLSQTGLTAACIDGILSKAGSPAAGTGSSWIEYSQKYGIDPAVGLAFFRQESFFGTKGHAVANKSVGNRTDSSGNFIAYDSWQASISDWFDYMNRKYVQAGKTTIEDIYLVYAPPKDNPNWQQKLDNVVSFTTEYRSQKC